MSIIKNLEAIKTVQEEKDVRQAILKQTITNVGSSTGTAYIYQLANVILVELQNVIITGSSGTYSLFTYSDDIPASKYPVSVMFGTSIVFIESNSREVKLSLSGNGSGFSGMLVFLVDEEGEYNDMTIANIQNSISTINANVDSLISDVVGIQIYPMFSASGNMYINTMTGAITTTAVFYLLAGTSIKQIPKFSLIYDTSRNELLFVCFNTSSNTIEIIKRAEFDIDIHYCVAIIDTNDNISIKTACFIDNVQNGRVARKKKINFLGDSITVGRGATAGSIIDYSYVDYTSKILNCDFVNYGIGGSTITAGTYGYYPMSERYVDMGEADIIFVFGGTNDFRYKPAPLGSPGDMDKDVSFYGALNTLIKGLMEKYPNSRILFSTPLQCYKDRDVNTHNQVLKDYVDAIKVRCENYSIPCLDLWASGNLCPNIPVEKINKIYDGLHPTADFHKNFLAKTVAGFIKQYI